MRTSERTLFLLILFSTSALNAVGQDLDRKMGIGALVGWTNGLAMKLYPASTISIGRIAEFEAIDINTSWNFNDYFFWNGHLLRERPVPDSPLHWFTGPGVAFGYDDGHLLFGPSAILGVYFDRERFDVFMQLSPRLLLIPGVRGEIGGAVGLRYYL